MKRLSLGVALIALAAAVLLFSDLDSRRGAKRSAGGGERVPRVALLYFASNQILEDTVEGVKESLTAHGYAPGESLDLQVYNAQGDIPTASSIAQTILDGGFDMVLTVSTPCLQAMASANQDAHLTHIFGAVTDPFGAGVGISREDPLDHPKYMAGIGTFQPVREAFELAKQYNPKLAVVGTPWNPGEACSEACVKLARETCERLGVKLIEAQVENSAGVFEAAGSLVARGAEALWIGGDSTVITATDSVVKAANQADIPVFTNSPSVDGLEKGVLFGLGANYHEVGRQEGALAAQVLDGLDPATVRIENVMPERLALNLTVLPNLKATWNAGAKEIARAAILKDGKGVHVKDAPKPDARPARKKLSKKWNLRFLHYVQMEITEATEAGFREGLVEQGLKEGEDYDLETSIAQGDMASLPMMVDAALNDGADLIASTSTPTLQAIIKKVKDVPVVFGAVADPVVAGAGKSAADHQANVTGICSMSDFDRMAEVVKQCLPQAKRIGTLFCPAELNSELYREKFAEVAQAHGLELEAVASSTSSEVPSSAVSLASSGVDAICQISDNLHGVAFASIAKAAQQHRLPLFCFGSAYVELGAAVAVARDFEQCGRDMAAMAARIMRGADPAQIPFEPVSKVLLVVNTEHAAACGLEIPQALLDEADVVNGEARAAPAEGAAKHAAAEPPVPKGWRPDRMWQLQYLNYVEANHVEYAHRGFFEEMQRLGLEEGRDYTMQMRNAQGDMATLSTLVDAARGDRPDLIVLTSTPTLQAVIQKIKDIPVVFSNVSNPIIAGAGTDDEHHQVNVTGIASYHDCPAMIALVKECLPGLKSVGTLYCPAEANSSFNRGELEKAAKAAGLECYSVASTSSADVPSSALALVNKRPDAICQVPDNIHDAAFVSITQAARRSRVPLFTFLTGQAVEGGAAVAYARDYEAAGSDAAKLVVEIMHGALPADLPFRPVSRTELVVNLPAARACGLDVPQSVLERADKVIR